jgi:NAD(P)-dependent dehydrogenase (short-subunit alcohol dehydrogenase family)
MKPLNKKVAVVAGATRGVGRGIAVMLGEAGATVYCTGRSTRKNRQPVRKGTKRSPFALDSRPETIEETAEMISAKGGKGIAVVLDHTEEEQVSSLFKRIHRREGKLDILVNDIWGGEELTEWGKAFWKLSMEKGLLMLRRSVFTHILNSRYAVPLMLDQGGLIVEITDGDFLSYRGQFFYDLVKTFVIRVAFNLAFELSPHKIASLAVTPGFLRSEAMLEHFGVTEENWQKAIKKDPNYAESETPFYTGRGIAALAADPDIMKKSGKVFSSWRLAEEYGFTDVDGRKPNWGKHFKETKDERVVRFRELMLQSHNDFIDACSAGLSSGK